MLGLLHVNQVIKSPHTSVPTRSIPLRDQLAQCSQRNPQNYLQVLSKLKVENELFERYVDDTTDGLAACDPGVRFIGKKLVKIEELVEEDKKVPDMDHGYIERNCKHNFQVCTIQCRLSFTPP